MRKIFISLVMSLFGGPLFAGVVAEGKVTNVANVAYNNDQFAVWVAGTGPCTFLLFKASNAVNADAMKRAYATALLALSLDKSVQIYNYTSDTCDGASYIQINK